MSPWLLVRPQHRRYSGKMAVLLLVGGRELGKKQRWE